MTRGLDRAWLRAEPGSERLLRFEDPVERLVAEGPEEVPGLLERAEAAAARGLWAVGHVGYEAAPAFDPALRTHAPASGPAPLATISLFAAPREVEAPAPGARPVLRGTPGLDEVAHRHAVEEIREAIARGDTYQVNLVFPFEGRFEVAPRELFAQLLAPGEAPYAALLEGAGWAVVSLSPELFFERADGRVAMRPMKGTRPRGRFGAEDRELAGRLAASEKDRAENLMIVDMVRNDLGRVAAPGSVAVEERFAIERYPTVWQMTSTVSAAGEARLPELFAALFPCASVTGAPKAATMRLIRELEGSPRGVYCGAIGFVTPGGRARFSVAIRTLELDPGSSTFRYGIGSGITWDSDPAEEWRECLAKARVLDGPPPEFELLETMRFRPGEGIARLALHLERMAASAEFFRFGTGGRELAAELRAAVESRCDGLPPASHRVRLRLSRDGAMGLEVAPFESERRAWSLAVAAEPVDSSDPFLFHKTTRRERYERAREGIPEEVDEVLLVNERGELTEGTRTNVILQFGGEWVTPRREAGLLAGVEREHWIREGRLVEATLYPRDLVRAHRVRLLNALRGWIPVTRRTLLDPAGRLPRR